ncbi:MAG: ROK family protein [Hydrogenibacillus sp.]|nr:ROK family protein [Hydrogenibacillus sp.]
MGYVLAVDLGGTSIKFGLVSDTGHIVERHQLKTPKDGGPAAVVRRIVEGLAVLREGLGEARRAPLQTGTPQGERDPAHDRAVVGVGVGVPGLVDVARGIVHLAPNLGWRDVSFGALLEEALDLPFALENDANAALLGERWRGAAIGVQDAIMVTLGTGVGGAVLSGGRILRGTAGMAGEIGHMPVHLDGVRCGCGNIGCLETESSATALVRHVEEMLARGTKSLLRPTVDGKARPTPLDIVRAAEAGDEVALAAFRRVGHYLGVALGGLVNVFNPERILIGGGLSASWELFRSALWEALRAHAMPENLASVRVERAALGNDAGVVGAAYAVFSRLGRFVSDPSARTITKEG